jgi:hypothetical protein
MSKVFPGPLTDLSAWVGFCTRTVPSLIYFSWDIYRDPPPLKIKKNQISMLIFDTLLWA